MNIYLKIGIYNQKIKYKKIMKKDQLQLFKKKNGIKKYFLLSKTYSKENKGDIVYG